VKIRWKISAAVALTAVLSSLPMGEYIISKQREQILKNQIADGKSNAALLAKNSQSILLLNAGEVLASRLDSREVLFPLMPLIDKGLVLAETILLSPDATRNGITISQLTAVGPVAVGSLRDIKPDQLLRIRNENLANEPQSVDCIGAQGKCIEFLSHCKLPNKAPFCVARVMIAEEKIFEPVNNLLRLVIGAATIVTILALFFALFISHLLTRPIGTLMQGVQRIAGGDLKHEVVVKTRDEIGSLSQAFNQMASNLDNSLNTLKDTNRAYFRFVPEEFLAMVGRKNILEVKLGDAIQRPMTVLFSDIRSFTTLTEKMSPGETFEFINTYLSVMGPLIRDHKGFVDKYIGDALMGLFPRNADDAVQAAFAMQAGLAKLNQGRDPPLKIGIGIHIGPVMLGMIGEAERMQGTVVADAVNLASRLEGLTKKFRANILISDETRLALETTSKVPMRYLGKIAVKGKSEEKGVFELLIPEQDLDQENRWQSAEEFASGVLALEQSDFLIAAEMFKRLAEANAADFMARVYWQMAREKRSKLIMSSK